MAAAFGLLAKTVEGANALTFVAAFAPYVSSAFVPAESMPAGLQWIAEHQPVTPIVDSVRALTMGTPLDNELWIAFAWCAAGIVVGRIAAAHLFRQN